jgi:hypothetical protein
VKAGQFRQILGVYGLLGPWLLFGVFFWRGVGGYLIRRTTSFSRLLQQASVNEDLFWSGFTVHVEDPKYIYYGQFSLFSFILRVYVTSTFVCVPLGVKTAFKLIMTYKSIKALHLSNITCLKTRNLNQNIMESRGSLSP